jgi:hypothetical protein
MKKRLMSKAFKFNNLFTWLSIFAIVYILAYLRPIHQDDGWYASFALRYMDELGIIENPSYFSYEDTLMGSDNPTGFIFAGLQAIFMSIFGFTVAAVRILNALCITGIIFMIYQFATSVLPKYKWLIVAVFALNPLFYHHFYNRPETLAALIVLISLYLLNFKGHQKLMVFLAFFLWALVLDTHPIAIFCLLGMGILFWIRNIKKSLLIIGGGLSGLIFILLFNHLINGNLGLLSGVFGQETMNFGDHYVPLLKSDLKDYLRIAIERVSSLFYFIILSGLLIMVAMLFFYKRLRLLLVNPLVINFIAFVVFVTFGTEASSNGFALYSLLMLFLVYIVCLNHFVESSRNKFSFYVFIPIIFWSISSIYIKINRSFNYQLNFEESARKFGICIPNKARVLMRPSFVFATYDKGLYADYTFGIMNVMIEKKLDFKSVLILKKYDYVIIDEHNLNYEFLIEKRDNNSFKNPAYVKYIGWGFKNTDLERWKQQGFLKEMCSFDDISHGYSILYKINREK